MSQKNDNHGHEYDDWDSDHDQAIATETKKKVQPPRMYHVILHNDNYTTMDFVVHVLTSVFHHDESEAVRIMLNVHQKGIGVAGTFSFEIAETKADRVMRMAKQREFPLQCTVEPA